MAWGNPCLKPFSGQVLVLLLRIRERRGLCHGHEQGLHLRARHKRTYELSRLLKENTQLPLEIKAIFRRVGRAARPVARLTREVGSKALDYPSP